MEYLLCALLAALPMHLLAASGGAQQISVTGSYKHNSPVGQWGRGMATTMYCGNSPESWVRGNATLDPSSGLLSLTVQLETDSASGGPKGYVTAVLKDGAGRRLATAKSEEIGTGGKSGSHAAIRNFSSRVTLDPSLAAQVRSIYLDAQCTGSIDRILNIRLGSVEDAFKIIVTVAAL
jgi:hypothetical protein